MQSAASYRTPSRRASARGFAAGGFVAAVAAVTLAACGPRDETPMVGGEAAVPTTVAVAPTTATPQAVPARSGSPVPAAETPPAVPAQTPTAALAPAPAYAPPPVTVAATPPPSYQDGPRPSQRVPAVQPATQAPVVPHDRIGSITAIDPVRQRPQGSGTGAVLGGVLGGVIGNQFGHGLGRAAMTGVGAAGGAIAGNNVERNYKTTVVGYRVHVRLDNGSTRTFERKSIGNLHVGDRVRVDAGGLRHA